jgi:hypothetical protein
MGVGDESLDSPLHPIIMIDNDISNATIRIIVNLLNLSKWQLNFAHNEAKSN